MKASAIDRINGRMYNIVKIYTSVIVYLISYCEESIMNVGNNYFDNLEEFKKEYFGILSDEIPDFLLDYINTAEMQKQAGISVSCGTIYSKLFNRRKWFSSLDHSIGVALIIWNFTRDKKQTLSGLFHDIATPVFKHCIDFMNGDYEKQESTEELTTKIIRDSAEIMRLLERDGIKVEEICDYHIYPIADNDTPKLSSDRLEYTLSNGLGVFEELWTLEEVKEIYNNIEVQINENGTEELGFKDKKQAEKFVNTMSKLSNSYVTNRTLISMQFLADIMRKMSEQHLITKSDLYNVSEKEIIGKIESCEYGNISECFNKWKNATSVQESDVAVTDKYCKSLRGKLRYINPLVRVGNEYIRINEVSVEADKDIQNVLGFKKKEYACLDFNF